MHASKLKIGFLRKKETNNIPRHPSHLTEDLQQGPQGQSRDKAAWQFYGIGGKKAWQNNNYVSMLGAKKY